MSDFLSTAATAALLGLSAASVRAIAPAELPRYRIGPRGGRIRYRRADVQSYLERCRIVPSGPIVLRRVVGRPDGMPARWV